MTALIILAAGESSRLGSPKQNLQFEGRTLLARAVEAGQKSACEKIIVVLGANSNEITKIKGTTILFNKDWKQGMASSIKTGMLEISDSPTINNVIIMLCDQPFVDSDLLDSLINKQIDTGKPVIACIYNEIKGVPVLFDRSLFGELLFLQGTEGAKKILRENAGSIVTIPFEKGRIDIDTPEDFEMLLNLSN